jgi:hypothetical protein
VVDINRVQLTNVQDVGNKNPPRGKWRRVLSDLETQTMLSDQITLGMVACILHLCNGRNAPITALASQVGRRK